MTAPVFFLGRVVQAFAGNAAWIIGFATIADTVEAENRSRTISTISVFFISGMLFGPMMSGSLIGLVGYWPTWLAAIAVLITDAIMLFLMVETRKPQRKDVENASGTGTGTGTPDETSSLLSGPAPARREPEQSPQQNGSIKPAAESFYKVILSNPRALTSMVCHATISLTLACFDTTLPLHVSRAFGWGPFQTSLMFLLLQVPTLLLSPLTGWMKDRWGTKIPSGIGFLAHAPLLWLLGAAGREGLPLVGSEQRGKTIYTITIVSLGIVRTLVTGCGTIEMTSKYSLSALPLCLPVYIRVFVLNLLDVVTELQERQPAIFSPNGGYSRAFSLTNMSWTFSMFIGPILSGALTETVGYYYMNICLGK
jgi:MFS family permease